MPVPSEPPPLPPPDEPRLLKGLVRHHANCLCGRTPAEHVATQTSVWLKSISERTGAVGSVNKKDARAKVGPLPCPRLELILVRVQVHNLHLQLPVLNLRSRRLLLRKNGRGGGGGNSD